MSAPEAAAALGSDERSVRSMAARGEIDAIKRGGAWWIDGRSVDRRRRQQPGRGRPLSPVMAWAVLLVASGADPAAVARGDHQARRAREWVAGHPLADSAAALRRRARREAFDIHPSELPRVAAREDVMPTGISAAAEVGIHGGRGEVEVYAPAGRRAALVADHALEPGDGPLLIRWMTDDVWASVHAAVSSQPRVAPRAAVLVDLLEHDDPRARREAARTLSHA